MVGDLKGLCVNFDTQEREEQGRYKVVKGTADKTGVLDIPSLPRIYFQFAWVPAHSALRDGVFISEQLEYLA